MTGPLTRIPEMHVLEEKTDWPTSATLQSHGQWPAAVSGAG